MTTLLLELDTIEDSLGRCFGLFNHSGCLESERRLLGVMRSTVDRSDRSRLKILPDSRTESN